jgi:flagellar biogenesis protein FliO
MDNSSFSPWIAVLTSFAALAFVLLLAWLFLRWLKRMQIGTSGDASAGPRVLRAVGLGPRERLVVVQHHDTELLLGVTAAGISVLDRRRTEAVSVTEPSSVVATPSDRP